jgi:protease PrsW
MAACSLGPAILLLWFFTARNDFAVPPSRILAAFVAGTLTLLPLWGLDAVLFPWLGRYHGATAIAGHAFIVAGGCEELVKWLAMMAFCARRAGTLAAVDCMVYGVAVGLGFAAVENLHYVLHYPAHWRGVALARGLMAVPFHAGLGVLMGALIAQAASRPAPWRAPWYALAWLGPALVHGCYDLPTLWRNELTGAPLAGVTSTLVAGLSLAEIAILIATVAVARLVAGHARRLAGITSTDRGAAFSIAWGAVACGGVIAAFAFGVLLETVATRHGLEAPLLADQLEGIGLPHLTIALVVGLILFEGGAVWLHRARRGL